MLRKVQIRVEVLVEQLGWYLNSAAVWVGQIAWDDDGLFGPCVVGYGAAWCYCMGLLVLYV